MGNPFPNSQEMQKEVQRRYWLGNEKIHTAQEKREKKKKKTTTSKRPFPIIRAAKKMIAVSRKSSLRKALKKYGLLDVH